MMAVSPATPCWGAALECNIRRGIEPRPSHASVKVVPVFALERIHEREQHAEEDQYDDADVDALALGRLADVVEIIDEIADEPLVLGAGERPGDVLREGLHDELSPRRRLDQGEPLRGDRGGLGLLLILVFAFDELLRALQAP